MTNNSVSFKSSPFLGILLIAMCLPFIPAILFFFQINMVLAKVAAILIILAIIYFVYIGYFVAVRREIIINNSGIAFKSRSKNAFNRGWVEISKIRTYKQPSADSYIYVLQINFIDNKKLEIGTNNMINGSWSEDSKKSIFKELIGRQKSYKFQVEDELNWAT